MRPGYAGLDTTLEPAASYAVQTPRVRVTVSERWNPVVSDQLELDTCRSGFKSAQVQCSTLTATLHQARWKHDRKSPAFI